MPNIGEQGGTIILSMSSEESERIAICCVLLDIVEAMGTSADIKGCRHYQSLRDKTDITDSDFEGGTLRFGIVQFGYFEGDAL